MQPSTAGLIRFQQARNPNLQVHARAEYAETSVRHNSGYLAIICNVKTCRSAVILLDNQGMFWNFRHLELLTRRFYQEGFCRTKQSAHGKHISRLSRERESSIRSKQKIYGWSDSFMNFKVSLRLTSSPLERSNEEIHRFSICRLIHRCLLNTLGDKAEVLRRS